MGPGVTRQGKGVHVHAYSPGATSMDLCLFDDADHERRIPMTRQRHGMWNAWLPECADGQRYGFRADGRWAPERGDWFNPSRLLLDPAARDMAGRLNDHPALLSVGPDRAEYLIDSAASMPKSVVMTRVRSMHATRPRIAWEDTVIYELHVKGLTQSHPQVDPRYRGRYEGLCAPAVIGHLRRLGVTTLQLMPIQAHADEPGLSDHGLTNYWGYNPLAFAIPDARYAIQDPVVEVCRMIDRLHAEGFEILLDVVFNHTAEGDVEGRTFSWRGLFGGWYHYDAEGRLINDSGCGNSVSLNDATVLRTVMDGLRHWATFYGVDGFRLDLAPVMGRRHGTFDGCHAFWMAIAQDPVLAGLKWIAEPWDLGPGGYQLGRFLPLFSQWNDQYREALRDVTANQRCSLAILAKRLAGSWDIFHAPGHDATSSINYVTCHDGPTLRDLITDPAGTSVQVRATLMALLAMSQGVPMISHGDEMGRTQGGERNAWCHDSAQTWCDWQAFDAGMYAVACDLFRWRHEWQLGHVFEVGVPVWTALDQGLRFFNVSGQPMTDTDWRSPDAPGIAIGIRTPVTALIMVVTWRAGCFRLPDIGGEWCKCFDSARVDPITASGEVQIGGGLINHGTVAVQLWRRRTD